MINRKIQKFHFQMKVSPRCPPGNWHSSSVASCQRFRFRRLPPFCSTALITVSPCSHQALAMLSPGSHHSPSLHRVLHQPSNQSSLSSAVEPPGQTSSSPALPLPPALLQGLQGKPSDPPVRTPRPTCMVLIACRLQPTNPDLFVPTDLLPFSHSLHSHRSASKLPSLCHAHHGGLVVQSRLRPKAAYAPRVDCD